MEFKKETTSLSRSGSFSERTQSFSGRSSSFKERLIAQIEQRKRSRIGSEMLNGLNESIRMLSEERKRELSDLKQIKLFTRSLKCLAYFFIFFASFLLLNSCIGFSSAPFYLPGVKCDALEPNEQCKYLKNLTYSLYVIELCGSMLLCIHGLLLIGLIDHIKNLSLIRMILKFTKFVSLLYVLLTIIRIGIYIRVHLELQSVDIQHKDQGFGNFLASYMFEDKTAAACITCLLMFMFGLCFLMNWCTFKLARHIE